MNDDNAISAVITDNDDNRVADLFAKVLDEFDLTKNATASMLKVSNNRIRAILKCRNLSEQVMISLANGLDMDLEIRFVRRNSTIQTIYNAKTEREARRPVKKVKENDTSTDSATADSAPAPVKRSRKRSSRKAAANSEDVG